MAATYLGLAVFAGLWQAVLVFPALHQLMLLLRLRRLLLLLSGGREGGWGRGRGIGHRQSLSKLTDTAAIEHTNRHSEKNTPANAKFKLLRQLI